MGDLERIAKYAVKRETKIQLGLVYADIKTLKEENRDLKQKHFELLKRIKAIEEFIRTKKPDEGTDFGM